MCKVEEPLGGFVRPDGDKLATIWQKNWIKIKRNTKIHLETEQGIGLYFLSFNNLILISPIYGKWCSED